MLILPILTPLPLPGIKDLSGFDFIGQRTALTPIMT